MWEASNFKRIDKGTLLGFFDIYIPEMQWKIMGCKLFKKNSSRWVKAPDESYIDATGEKKYKSFIYMTSEASKKFDVNCIDALSKLKGDIFT